MLNGALRLEGWHQGWHLNHKRTYRLYNEDKLDLRPKHRKRLKSEKRDPLAVAAEMNEIWSLDFTSDRLSDDRSFRALNVIDLFTRRCLSIETDTSLSGERVVRVFDVLVQQQGKPKLLRIDNGPEFRSQKLDRVPLGRRRTMKVWNCTSSSQGSRPRTATSKASPIASGWNA
jgi:transposase InsO family protein